MTFIVRKKGREKFDFNLWNEGSRKAKYIYYGKNAWKS